ncbi:MAG TPA: ABC transporter permease, partial [Actinomycetota bacterium]|nr:ABC transporter permease [Actinomycetota bacterium]
PLLGQWERWVAGASPLAATQKLSQTSDVSPELAGSLAGWPSLLLIAGYVVAALLAAWVLLRRRDVQ